MPHEENERTVAILTEVTCETEHTSGFELCTSHAFECSATGCWRKAKVVAELLKANDDGKHDLSG